MKIFANFNTLSENTKVLMALIFIDAFQMLFLTQLWILFFKLENNLLKNKEPTTLKLHIMK